MRKIQNIILLIVLMFGITALGCAGNRPVAASPVILPKPRLTMIQQIDSFKPEIASQQALEVINNNPYEQDFFEEVFDHVVTLCENNKSEANADIIWNALVVPLTQSGKVPPDLAKTTWNYYFSRQFVSLPDGSPVGTYCHQIAEIKKNIEKEYVLKKKGFEICLQGTPDAHFLNAMYVYNTIWAACHHEN